MQIGDCILYRDLGGLPGGDIPEKMEKLARLSALPKEEGEGTAEARRIFFGCIGSLLTLASEYGFTGNIWQASLTFLLASHENAFSTALEIGGRSGVSLRRAALHDMLVFRELFALDLSAVGASLETGQHQLLLNFETEDDGRCLHNPTIRARLAALKEDLAAAADEESFLTLLEDFYREYGVGRFGLGGAFRIGHLPDGTARIISVPNVRRVHFEDLVGYESSKKKLIDNTEAFIEGRPANNCLLYGEAGTGKSSSIKALLERYYSRGLRIIEVTRYDFRELHSILGEIKNRRYRFLLYMDDLSFEENETEYKFLKAVIEGGLEKKPSNVLLYATSNRRHLIRENYRDKEDRYQDMHASATVQEKLSLAARFGLQIYYGSPDRKEYEEIVLALAGRRGLELSDSELFLRANAWALAHGGYSGRTAQQFVDDLSGKQNGGL